MNSIALDCSTELLSIALETPRGSYLLERNEGLKHSENLMAGIDWIMKQAGLAPKDLDLVVCSLGPGSFTGLRIAMATAKALARGGDASLKAVSQLDCYGRMYQFFPGLVVPIIDARKKCFYTALYEDGSRKSDYLDIPAETLEEKLTGHGEILFCGPHAEIYPHLSGQGRKTVSKPEGSMAPMLLQMGKEAFEEDGRDPMDIGPMYLRKSEAEIAMENSK